MNTTGVVLWEKPKDLSGSEREERGYGESTENVDESVLCTTYDVVCLRKAARHLWRSTAFAHNGPFYGDVECDKIFWLFIGVVYYESIKREPKIRGIYECRCDERLQTKSKEFTRLAYTGLVLELEHLKTETRLIIGVVYFESRKQNSFWKKNDFTSKPS